MAGTGKKKKPQRAIIDIIDEEKKVKIKRTKKPKKK